MSYIIFLLGFMFNIGFLLETLGLPVSGVSILFWIVLLILSLVGKLNHVKIPRNYVAFILIFFLYYTFSFLFFSKTAYSNYKYTMVLVKMPVLMLIPFCISEDCKKFFTGYVASLILVLFLLVVQTRSLLTTSSPDINTRLEVEGLNPIWISRLILETILIAGIILKTKRKYLFLLFLVCLPVLYSSGSKGPILSYLIAYGIYKLRDIKLNFRTAIYSAIILAGGAIALWGLSNIDENSYIIQRFFRAVPDASSDEIKEMSRVMVWPMTIEKSKESPTLSILAGYGVGNFSKFYLGTYSDERFYPHNFFLELLIEQGLPFMLFVGIFLFYFFRKSKNNFKYIFLFFFVNSMFSGDIILNELIFFYLSFALMNKSIPNENTVSHIRELPESTNNTITGYKPI